MRAAHAALILACLWLHATTGQQMAPSQHRRMACVYTYFEKNEQYRSNLAYFLAHAILPHVDYFLVVNGNCSLDLARLPPHVQLMTRPNEGYDFGGWGHALLAHDIPRRYPVVAFINSSVRGPFLCATHRGDWTSPFLARLQASPATMLVGTSINVHEAGPHVQSMVFFVRQPALTYLQERGIFAVDDPSISFDDLVDGHEIRMSTLVLARGWNIDSVLAKYQGVDYRVVRRDFNPSSRRGDPYFTGAYFYSTIDPYEAVFFKVNRFKRGRLPSSRVCQDASWASRPAGLQRAFGALQRSLPHVWAWSG